MLVLRSVRPGITAALTLAASACGGTVIFDEAQGEGGGSSEAATTPADVASTGTSTGGGTEAWRATAEKQCGLCLECGGCSDEFSECLAYWEAVRNDAAELGCLEPWDAYWACYVTHVQCVGDELPPPGECDDQAVASNACMYD